MADRPPLDQVVRKLLDLRNAGRPAAEAEATARQMGYAPEEIRGTLAKAPSGYIESLVQGPTFGFGDEIGSGIDAGIRALKGEDFGKAYGEELGKNRAALAVFQDQHPYVDAGIQIAGGAALPLGGAVRGASTLAGAAARGAVTGAATGALAGFGTGEGEGDRAARAVGGGVLGGVVGGPLGVAGEGIARAASLQTGRGAAGAARSSLAEAVSREGVTPGQAADAIAEAQRAGKAGVTPADVMQSGPVGGLLRDVAQSPNPMQGAAREQIGARQRGQFERVIGDLGAAAGIGDRNAVSAMDRLLAERASAARPDFDRAFRFDTASSPEAKGAFADLIGTDAGQRAYQRASAIARNEMPGYPVPRLEDMVDAQGNLTTVPDMRMMHFVKMGLDDLHSGVVSGAESGMSRTMASSIRGVRDRYRQGLAQANPDYQQALGRFAGYSALRDAVEHGREAIALPPDEFASAMAGLGGPGEQQMFRLGAVSRLSDMLGKQRRGDTTDLTQQLRSINMEQKLPMLIGEPDAAGRFDRQLDVERRFSDTAGRVKGNSSTSEGRELSELASGDVGVGQVLDAARGGGGGFIMSLLQSTLGRVAGPIKAAVKSRYRDQMGQMLTQTDGGAETLLRALEQRPPGPSFRAPQTAVPLALTADRALLGPPRPDDEELAPIRYRGVGLGR